MKLFRLLILFAGTGLIWFGALNLFFVYSGAQQILADPALQSTKFIKAFTEYEPLPRMATEPSILWKGLILVGLLAALAFSIVNNYLKGGWLKRGLVFGSIHWLLMTPWFEFYLPYNVMQEPLPLVLLEAALWLCLTLTLGLFMSFTLNFKRSV